MESSRNKCSIGFASLSFLGLCGSVILCGSMPRLEARPLGQRLQSQQKPAALKQFSPCITYVKAEEHKVRQCPQLGSCAGRHRLNHGSPNVAKIRSFVPVVPAWIRFGTSPQLVNIYRCYKARPDSLPRLWKRAFSNFSCPAVPPAN